MKVVPAIKVRNAQRSVRVQLRELQRFSERALQLALLSPTRTRSELRDMGEITVALISDRRMAALHRRFMDLEGATDVITFQHGDIFVSVETAQRNGAQFGTSTEKEIKLYIVHGFLHLHGFDDTTPAESRLMKETQKRILAAAQKASAKEQRARAAV
ncbi:MAG: rRNA maturation RNase YbeY [Burkholderiaceae bacterium]|nr:rRNA maturation RNase YbeY [Burkholderiaceae bacterium]